MEHAGDSIEEVLKISDYELPTFVPRSLGGPAENAESDVHGLINVASSKDLNRYADTRCTKDPSLLLSL